MLSNQRKATQQLSYGHWIKIRFAVDGQALEILTQRSLAAVSTTLLANERETDSLKEKRG